MSLTDEVARLMKEGYWPSEIKSMLPSSSPRTIIQYCYTINKGLSDAERADMLAKRNLRPKPTGGNKDFFQRKVVSAFHVLVGSKIYYYRRCLEMNLQQFSDFYKFSNRVQLSAMEQGYHDFTLSEMTRLSEITQLDIPALLKPNMETNSNDLSANRVLPNDTVASSSAA